MLVRTLNTRFLVKIEMNGDIVKDVNPHKYLDSFFFGDGRLHEVIKIRVDERLGHLVH